MDRPEKLALIDGFSSAYSVIEDLIRELPPEALGFVPPVAEAWSTNDHLVHLLDADAVVWYRIRVAVAEPGTAIPVWDEERWHGRLSYSALDGRACLSMVTALRREAGAYLRAIIDEDWGAFHVLHPVRGRMSLADLLTAYRDHVAFHTPLVKRNRDAWKAARTA